MSTKNLPSIDYLRQCLREDDGRIFWLPRPKEHFVNEKAWKVTNSNCAGKEAGTARYFQHEQKYRWRVTVNRRFLFRYTVVWAFHTGEIRLGLDHIDRDQLNDRFDNLRPADQSQNTANIKRHKDNTTGYKGVCWVGDRGKFVAQIGVKGKHHFLGYFDDPAEAHAAYVKAAQEHFGEFHCGG